MPRVALLTLVLVGHFAICRPVADWRDTTLPKFYRWQYWHATNPSVPVVRGLIVQAYGQRADTLSLPQLAVWLARKVQGTPYAKGTTKGVNPNYKPILNWKQLDCYTLVDNCAALAWAIKQPQTGREGWSEDELVRQVGCKYLQQLERLRYRHGSFTGLTSRLHYATDLLGDNERRGLLKNLTSHLKIADPLRNAEVASAKFRTVSKAAGHSWKDRLILRRIEDSLAKHPMVYLPVNTYYQVADQLKEGDWILVVPHHKPGVEVSHVGMVTAADGFWRLIHASSEAGKVVISAETLSQYLQRKSIKGFLVVRLQDYTVKEPSLATQ